jgi:hypothetical protein
MILLPGLDVEAVRLDDGGWKSDVDFLGKRPLMKAAPVKVVPMAPSNKIASSNSGPPLYAYSFAGGEKIYQLFGGFQARNLLHGLG